ncbi:MAG: PQQ-like beta-propeller repeat protein, partial [Actinomycetota bacterium]|nr:PQQ-like beta-propeller repeat protein [Actinomycetota bacterium]
MLSKAKNLWQNHRLLVLAGTCAVLAVGVLVAYSALKRPGDVSNEDAVFQPEDVNAAFELGDWPVYGLNAERTRYLEANVEPPFQVKWQFKGRSLLEYAPVLHNNVLYLTNKNGEFFSINPERGKRRYKLDVGELSAASPAVDDKNRVFVSTLEPGNVTAIDGLTGQVLWEQDLPGRSESSPVVADGEVIVGCECGSLFAFDADDGKKEWEAELGGAVKAAPAVDEGIAYVGDYGGQLSAVRIDDGSIKWQTGTTGGSFGRAGAIYATAAVAFGRVYVGSKDSRMYSFEKETGKLAWSKSTGDEVYAAAVAADTPTTSPTIYFGSYDGSFYALDAKDGSTRWQRDVGGAVSGAASLIGETVYVAELSNTNTFGYSTKDGDQVWEFRDGTYNP